MKNTVGMVDYSPSKLIKKTLDKKIVEKIIKPTLKGLNEMGSKFIGFLYAGLMIVKNEPYLIEYNVRMGDPECQTILPRLKSDMVDILYSCIEEKLSSTTIEWHEDKTMCVVLCSKGYPDKYQNNLPIENLEKISLQANEFIFHAGTINKNNKIYSNGGRVLNFVSIDKNFKNAKNNTMKLIKKLNWPNGYYRKDIGFKVIE